MTLRDPITEKPLVGSVIARLLITGENKTVIKELGTKVFEIGADGLIHMDLVPNHEFSAYSIEVVPEPRFVPKRMVKIPNVETIAYSALTLADPATLKGQI